MQQSTARNRTGVMAYCHDYRRKNGNVRHMTQNWRPYFTKLSNKQDRREAEQEIEEQIRSEDEYYD